MVKQPSNILLLSIKPQYADQIFAGTKQVELRRVRTRLQAGDLVLIYVSSPERALVGSFEVEEIIVEDLPENLNIFWCKVKEKAAINRKIFDDYYQGASVGVGIFCTNIQRFKNPINLDTLRKKKPHLVPPQCYRYLTHGELTWVKSMTQ